MTDSVARKLTPDVLYIGIESLIVNTDWDPPSVSGNDTIRMIEVKAMLLNAQKKLRSIEVRESDAT